MGFGSFFGQLAHAFGTPAGHVALEIGAAAAGAIAPGLGSLIETLANTVYAVEAKSGQSTAGAAKKDEVKGLLDMNAPLVLAVLSQLSGRPATPADVAPVLDRLIDDIVALFNAIGVFQHGAASGAVAGPAATPAAQ